MACWVNDFIMFYKARQHSLPMTWFGVYCVTASIILALGSLAAGLLADNVESSLTMYCLCATSGLLSILLLTWTVVRICLKEKRVAQTQHVNQDVVRARQAQRNASRQNNWNCIRRLNAVLQQTIVNNSYNVNRDQCLFCNKSLNASPPNVFTNNIIKLSMLDLPEPEGWTMPRTVIACPCGRHGHISCWLHQNTTICCSCQGPIFISGLIPVEVFRQWEAKVLTIADTYDFTRALTQPPPYESVITETQLPFDSNDIDNMFLGNIQNPPSYNSIEAIF